MKLGSNTEKCFTFISTQLSPPAPAKHHSRPRPAVTLSRQSGSGAMKIANLLADYLQDRCPERCPWTIFDRNIVEKVFEEHHLPKSLAKFMPEDRISAIQDMMEELLGLHPPSWTLQRQTTETIAHLAQLGHVILIGRASNIITRQMENVLHVRLVAPLETRVARVMERSKTTRAAALELLKKEDLGRKRYLKDNFEADVDDPLLYDMVINTARLAPETVAHLIGDAVLHRVRVA